MTLYQKENPSSIQSLFDTIAPRYDVGNSLMSFHMHSLWNKRLARELLDRSRPKEMLDLCAGTGEIVWRALAYALKQGMTVPHFHLIDFSSEMLQIAKSRSQQLQGQFLFTEANVEALPLGSSSFDAVSIAYGIRNVQHMDLCMKEVYRVLRPGGWLGIIELTRPKTHFMRYMHNIYLKTMVPMWGKWAIRNEDAYKYLCKSIQSFICPEKVLEILRGTGFTSTSSTQLCGGIATLFFAQKEQ
jgi:demethylmenaquinone methyltransferase / 2-methoxy-6-polyprenyl-1,4-benzoquinol methylase